MEDHNQNISIKFNLMENGIDFIIKGIDELFDETYSFREAYCAFDITQSGYKYGCLHLFSGFLLLLKERLSHHLPEVIFIGKLADIKNSLSDPKKAIKLKTVNLEEAIERLEIGPRVIFTDDELQTIKKMQNYRNQFEHFEISANRYELWKTVSNFLLIIDKFLLEELNISIEKTTKGTELLDKITNIESVWKRIEKQQIDDWYSEMDQKLIELKENHESIKDDLLAAQYRSKGDIIPWIYCPDCGEECLINYGEYTGICMNADCYSLNPISSCDRCGEPVVGFSWEFQFCEACMDWILNTD